MNSTGIAVSHSLFSKTASARVVHPKPRNRGSVVSLTALLVEMSNAFTNGCFSQRYYITSTELHVISDHQKALCNQKSHRSSADAAFAYMGIRHSALCVRCRAG